MKKQIKFLESIPGVALATALILAVPLVAMQFTDEINWGVADFIIMGALLFGAGVAYVLLVRFATNFIYRAAIGMAIGSTLFMIWANLAVGLIGSGPHAGNLMYIGVVAVVIIGIFLSQFTARGMERAMFSTALSLVLLAIIALAANMQEYPGSSVVEIIGVNAFFAILFTVSGLLFRNLALEQSQQVEKS